jgi:hypothetical protein
MSQRPADPKPVADIARRELTKPARSRGDDIQRTLTRYAIVDVRLHHAPCPSTRAAGSTLGHPSKPAWHDDAYLGQIMAEVVEPGTIEPLLSGFWRIFGLEHRPMDRLV